MKNFIEILKSKSTEEKQRIWFGVFISLILFAVLFFIFVEKFLTYEQAKALGGNTISVIMFALYLFLLSLSAKKMAGKSSLEETAKISTGLEYEKYVAKQLRHKGYLNIKVTKGSGDFGADILATLGANKICIQCKYYSSPVGIKAVQEIASARIYYKCDKAIVITNNIFTPAAKELAKKADVELIERFV